MYHNLRTCKDVKVGDVVRIYDHWGNHDAKVATVGRKWFTVIGTQAKFSLEDGSNSGTYSEPFAKTLSQHAEDTKQEQLCGMLRNKYVVVSRGHYPSDVLRALLDVVEAVDDD